jgi:predicted O-methyltransferase YrrM
MNAAIHALKYLLGFDDPQSQVTYSELECLLSYALQADVVVEIGCYEGRTAMELAKAARGRVYSVDPFFRGRLGICYGELIARTHRRRQGVDNVKFIKGFSHEVAPQFTYSIDLLFVDADHAYEAIKQDWQDWFPKVRPGGIIALHDCKVADSSPDYLGSMKFYDQDIPKMSGIEQVDSVGSLAIFRVQTAT